MAFGNTGPRFTRPLTIARSRLLSLSKSKRPQPNPVNGESIPEKPEVSVASINISYSEASKKKMSEAQKRRYAKI